MSMSKRCGMGAVAGLLLLGLVATQSAAAAAPEDDCSARLAVELTPDVPDATNAGLLCRKVVEAMRRDARVQSIHVDSAESPSTLITSVPAGSPELWGVPVSSTGIGSLYWAAHHPRRAWKVLLPVRSQDSGEAE